MNNKIKGLIFETVSEVLLEGRLEDVKSKYDEGYADDIDRLSQSDPSGNNKYLAWMANQYINVLGQDRHNFDMIVDAVTRFHSEQARINPNMSKEVVEVNPDLYPGRETRRVSNNPKDINSYSSVQGLLKVVEEAEEGQPDKDEERLKIYQDSKWTVVIPKTHEASCKYGRHSAWCVSTSNPTWFGNYTRDGMLAFVLWRQSTEGLEREGEYKVAVNIKYNSPEYRNWHWYNKKDTRMDNDLPLAVFPPELIQAIKDNVKTMMKASGYLVEIDEEELNEKAHILKISGEEGSRRWWFIPKLDQSFDWLRKYEKNGGREYMFNVDTTQVIPFFKVSEPNGRLEYEVLDLTNTYKRLKSNPSSWRPNTAKQVFYQSIPYNFRSLGDEKKEELFDFVKTHFQEKWKGFIDVATNDLQIGDYVRWERKTRRDRSRLGRYKQGEIVRQTPSGFFVVNVEGEDKPARFKPDYGKYMGKRYEPENLDMSVWDYVPEGN